MLKKMLVKQEINTFFFGLLFLCICFLPLLNTSRVEHPILFTVYTLGQVSLEIGCLLLIAQFLRGWALWGGYFFLLLVHGADFFVVRTKGSGIICLFKFLFGGGWDHFVAAIQAGDLNTTTACSVIGALVIVPLLGPLVYAMTDKLSRRIPLLLSPLQIAVPLSLIALGLASLDLSIYSRLPRATYTQHVKALPLGTVFLSPPVPTLALTTAFPQAGTELKELPPLSSSSLPNIYFFVIETLRRDYATEETAPHLTAFAREYGEFRESFANANASDLSWFALFHSAPPYQWTTVRDQWTQGAVPLRVLKQLGYQIRAYSSTNLKLFQMDHILFGENGQLLDYLEDYAKDRTLKPCERDQCVIQSACRDLKNHRTGTVFLVFLDATHSEYSFPKDWPCHFLPIIEEINYLTLNPTSPALEGLKNRYRNAIHFVDHLIGKFLDTLKQETLFEEGVISITGDHGEEFYEEGNLFHGAQLNRYQTSVPILLKAGSWRPHTESVTHMDLFPSILHFVTGQSEFGTLFSGRSVFVKGPRPPRMIVLDQGPDTPREFLLEKGKERLHARFTNNPLILEVLEDDAGIHK